MITRQAVASAAPIAETLQHGIRFALKPGLDALDAFYRLGAHHPVWPHGCCFWEHGESQKRVKWNSRRREAHMSILQIAHERASRSPLKRQSGRVDNANDRFLRLKRLVSLLPRSAMGRPATSVSDRRRLTTDDPRQLSIADDSYSTQQKPAWPLAYQLFEKSSVSPSAGTRMRDTKAACVDASSNSERVTGQWLSASR
jgi:hypothetical protein